MFKVKIKSNTYRFNGSFQAINLLLKQMKCSGFATMTCECSCTSIMNAIHPILQFHLIYAYINKTIEKRKSGNISEFKRFIMLDTIIGTQ